MVEVRLGIQTNGTLLDDCILDTLGENRVFVGVSLDGPKDINDAHRVDHRGMGTFDLVENGLRCYNGRAIPSRFCR